MQKIKAKFSNKYHAIQRRIKNLPVYGIALLKSPLKKYALSSVKNFQQGIRKNAFGLEKLKEGTIQRKRYLGMERPETPLYGLGDSVKKKSYINMLRVKELRNGFMVFPSKGDHYSGLKMKKMFHVHEYGTIIRMKSGKLIRIPPRPALLKAYEKTLIDRKVQEDSKKVKSAMIKFIRQGELTALNQTAKQFTKALEKYEVTD